MEKILRNNEDTSVGLSVGKGFIMFTVAVAAKGERMGETEGG